MFVMDSNCKNPSEESLPTRKLDWKSKINSPHHRLQKKNFDSPSKKRKQTENSYPRESTLEVGEHTWKRDLNNPMTKFWPEGSKTQAKRRKKSCPFRKYQLKKSNEICKLKSFACKCPNQELHQNQKFQNCKSENIK